MLPQQLAEKLIWTFFIFYFISVNVYFISSNQNVFFMVLFSVNYNNPVTNTREKNKIIDKEHRSNETFNISRS